MSKGRMQGSCHCKAVRFEVELDLAAGTSRCNCSICLKTRAWSAIVKPAAFRLAARRKRAQRLPVRRQKSATTCSARRAACGRSAAAIIEQIGGDFVSINIGALDDASDAELANAPVQFMNGRDNDWFNVPKRNALPLTAYAGRSRSSRRRILPDGDFGIASTKSTRRTFLYGATLLRDVRHQLVGRRGALQHDERARQLAALGVGQRHDGRVGDGRVRQQRGLELRGRHLHALVLDELLEPVDDVEIAVGVGVADVARVQPAVGVDASARVSSGRLK